MATSTTVATATPAPVVQVSTKLIAGIVSLLTLQVQVGNKFESLADQTKVDIKTYGLDRKGARLMLQTAFEKAHTEQAKKEKVPQDQMVSHIQACLQRSGPDISKILTLASPKDEAAAVELEKAKEAGLGLNKQLEIARGNTTVAAIQQEAANKALGAAKETARPQSGSTPQSPAPESATTAKLTPKERLENQFVAVIKFGESLGLQRTEVLEHLSNFIANMEAEAEKAATVGVSA